MLGKAIPLDVVVQLLTVTPDQNILDEVEYELAVDLGFLQVGDVGLSVHHRVARRVRPLPLLDIVPVFDHLLAFEAKDLETDIRLGEIVLGMSKKEGEEWYTKILNLITNNNGNNTDN